MSQGQSFAIRLRRLDSVGGAPGLIRLLVHPSEETRSLMRVGALTDVALRGRVAHFDLHPANEVAALRKALAVDSGQATLYESWSALGSCLQFWCGFVGSPIRRIEWTCEKCGKADGDLIGASVGETFLRSCACGALQKVVVPR